MQVKTWQVPRIWEGGEVWILGGGPSLIDCFNIPNEVVYSVRHRKQTIEAYSPYLAAIHSKHVIGINVAYKFGNWVDICFFGDKHFYLEHRAGFSYFRKLLVTCHVKVGQKNIPWIKYLPIEKQNGMQKMGISTNPGNVCWNTNSGAAAISIAAWTGAKRIVLVGFDMTLGVKDRELHFHNEYRQVGSRIPEKKLPFSKHLPPWTVIRSDADSMGIEILNTSLNSEIKEIPKVHIKELL